MYQISTLYTLGLYEVIRQLYLSKADGGERKKSLILSCSRKWITAKNLPFLYDSGKFVRDPIVYL